MGNPSVDRVLQYLTGVDRSRLTNISPVTLSFSFELRVPQIYKSGFGRPDIKAYKRGISSYRGTKTRDGTVSTGEPGKGFIFFAEGFMEPGGYLDLEFVDVEYDNTMLPNRVSLIVTDDYSQVLTVIPAPPTRDVLDGGEEQENAEVVASVRHSYDYISMRGPGLNGQRYQEVSSSFPAGIVATQSQTSQGTKTFISNLGADTWYGVVNIFIEGYTGAMYTAGNADGSSTIQGGASTRVFYVFDMAPGASFACEAAAFGPRNIWGSLSFVAGNFADRYNEATNIAITPA